ncbi:MAG TPA: ribosome-associated GTPase EngA, partial [Firmicutes bacterium]|nr:ribosome-associated GTPase EngA [Bacillota bacterium]
RGLVIGVNKWDLIGDRKESRREWQTAIERAFSFVSYAPVIFFSALTGSRVEQLFPLTARVQQELYKRISTSLLNELVADALAVNPPAATRGKQLKLYYATQVSVRPPTFLFFVNDPRLVHFSYQRYLENRLREAFDFNGVPLRLNFKARREKE